MYIFDVDSFVESSLHDGCTAKEVALNMEWAKEIDGELVDMTKELWGYCKGYKVAAEWCRKVEKVMVFDKKLYLKTAINPDEWCDLIDGLLVGFTKETDSYGYCKDFIIAKEWCREFKGRI